MGVSSHVIDAETIAQGLGIGTCAQDLCFYPMPRGASIATMLTLSFLKCPPGIHVSQPEQVLRAAQKNGLQAELQDWLGQA